jgi:hypothetical protein
MARLLPTGISELSLSLGETAELRTLARLRNELPAAYAVFHSVDWTRDSAYRIAFGEADFIIVNQSGDTVVIEQKFGTLEESPSGLIKRYADGRKNVAIQIHRTIDGLREQFKRQSGHDLNLDYLIYCPDHRVRDLNAAGLTASRIVDASDADRLPARIVSILPQGTPSDFAGRVLRFFENKFHLVPDIHAQITAGERAMARLSGGLVETLSAFEMSPLKLRVRGTAGCGKSVVATQFAETAYSAGKRVLLVCFNRPLAERMKMSLPQGAYADTFYGLMDRFLKSRGHRFSYELGQPDFWVSVQERVIGETIGADWKFDSLIVDEGQDFERQWCEILRLFLAPDADLLWLEDLNQSIRPEMAERSTSELAYESLSAQFIGFRAKANYRSPETIARYILRVLPFDFVPANPTPGLGVGVSTYKDSEDQGKVVASIVTELIRSGFKHSDIVILSMRGLARATFAQTRGIGNFTFSRPTGEYDLLGNQVFESGQLRFDTVYRFKGQQAPAVIVTDIDPSEERLDHAERLLFTGMTRATVRLEIVARKENSMTDRLMKI